MSYTIASPSRQENTFSLAQDKLEISTYILIKASREKENNSYEWRGVERDS